MIRYQSVAKVADVPPGTMKGYRVGARDVLVANVDGDLVAMDDVCTHAQCNLSEGDMEDDNVVCPCHGGEFNLRTGQVEVGPPATPLDVFFVRVQGDAIEIGFPES